MLAGVLAFFATVIAVNVVFIVAALRTFPGEEEQKPYFQGLHYNDTLEERRRQEALGWRVIVDRAERHENGVGVVGLTIEGRNGDPVRGLTVTGALARPASEAVHQLDFDDLGDGRYTADIESLGSGVWDLAAHASDAGGQEFDVTARIVFK